MKKIILLLILSFACLFTVAACGNTEEPATPVTPEVELSKELRDARSYLVQLYGDGSETATAADFYRVSQVPSGDAKLAIAWASNSDKVAVSVVPEGEDKAGMTLVDVTIGAEAIKYVLTATVTGTDGSTLKLEFNHVVPAAKAATIADFIAAKDQESYTALTGVITAVNKVGQSGSFILTDATGSIFCYDGLDVKLGDEVTVIGQLSMYNDVFPQLAKPALAATISTGKDVKVVSGTPLAVDATEIKADLAGDLNAKYAGKYLEITGYVMKNPSGYINLKAALEDTDACVNLYKNDEIALTEELVNQKVKIYGFMRGSSSSYITIQVQGFEVVQEELTPAQEVERALASIELVTEFSENASVELPASRGNVTYTWAIVGEAAGLAIAEGNLNVTIGEANATYKIKVTATCGEASDSKEFDIKLVAKMTFTSLADAYAEGDKKEHNQYTTEKYVVVGTIKEITNPTYGNMVITDGTTELTIYGVYVEGAKFGDVEGTKPAAGDVVVLKGVLGKYSSTVQMKNADLVSWEIGTKHATISNEEATELALNAETPSDQKYTIKGVVTKITNETYGNIYVKDVYGTEFYVYGTYSHDGATRFDKLTTKPAVGDFVVVTGALSTYNGAAQMKNGWLLQLNTTDYAASTTPDTDEPTPAPEVTGGLVIEAYAAANSWTNSTKYETITYDESTTISATGTPTGNYGLNTGKYYTSGQNWRIYQAESPEVTITSTKTIATVTIEYDSNNGGVLTSNGNQIESKTTVEVNGTTITFSVGNTGTATNGQARITKIIIVYAE